MAMTNRSTESKKIYNAKHMISEKSIETNNRFVAFSNESEEVDKNQTTTTNIRKPRPIFICSRCNKL